MKTDENILTDGIQVLRKNDEDIERLISSHGGDFFSLLDRYISEIELFNSAYGLVGTSDRRELIVKHILDSLAPAGIISRLLAELCANDSEVNPPHIADAGSGAGLPGIPLSIIMPRCDFTLIERMNRRTGFLWNVKASLNLSNVSVEETELEKTAPGRFRLVTFRAFKPLEPKLLKSIFRICADDGIIAAYKGRLEKIKKEMLSLEKLCGKWEAISYAVPFLDEERHLLVIKPLSANIRF
ncbi:MAG: 16S rRNA (guanine(527)-N(7))-methyltransferase RsmG [Treponema sp.]|jgi:16S rRNA (guanine527-N7)-methyltransferase|nr:16S rRNA (guanine(527)-N(7))-methyltransferase RsmG [Treponema sp.]